MPSGLEATLVVLCWAYVAGLTAWLAARVLLADRLHVLFYVNSLAHLFFLPAPIAFVFAVALPNSGLIAATALAALGFAYFWLLPAARPLRRTRGPNNRPVLRVATFNLLWVNDDSAAIIAAIRALDADVLALQELTPERSAEIEPALAGEYPHRLLFPRPKAYGTALLCRVPLTLSTDTIPDPDWIGDPVIATLTFDGVQVSVLCVHAAAVRLPAASRERQARALVAYAAAQQRPCVIMGDFNTTPLNAAYPILAGGLQDAWTGAGGGFGHTFPGPGWINASGDGLPRPLRRFVPHWLLRIDHVLLSRHWRAVSVRTGALSGGSDHRPLVAEITLRD